MLSRFFFIGLIFSSLFRVSAQKNIELIGQLTFPGKGDLSDIWGHVDVLGNEYALVGIYSGTSIVDVSIPENPVEVFFSPGANSIWRDLKVWNNHAYIVNESDSGLKIIDMSNLPGPITSSDVYEYRGVTYPFTSAHDIYIDENGFAYVMGANNGKKGAIILDLNANPKLPQEVGRYDEFYIHDGMVRGDTLWAGCVEDGFFAVIDVTDKSNPITMATHPTPSLEIHNIWRTDDGKTVFTTDEKSNAFIGVYDVSDLNNINEMDRIQSSPGEDVIPHNAFVLGDYLVTSYYRDGVIIHDATDPSNLVEVGNYDTSPQFSGNGFNGCWGVYPYFPSGIIIASDIENGLFVLSPTYSRASYLKGKVAELGTNTPLDGVQIEVLTSNVFSTSNILGNYQTGISEAGTYFVRYSKNGYLSKTIEGVVFSSGNTTSLDVLLEKSQSIDFTMELQEELTNEPVQDANVIIEGNGVRLELQSDENGGITLPDFLEGDYEIYISKWGYESLCLTNQFLSEADNSFILKLKTGYQDDFKFDLGWTVTGDAVAGFWERDIPLGTIFNDKESNPSFDSQKDCSEEAYVTGNLFGSAGFSDVDDGETILLSPLFDISAYDNPEISYDRWFFNDGQAPAVLTDYFVVEILNGNTSIVLDSLYGYNENTNAWITQSFLIKDLIPITATMQLKVKTADVDQKNIVEAGLDNFKITEKIFSSTSSIKEKKGVSIYPNPFKNQITINLEDEIAENLQYKILDLSGRLIEQKAFKNKSIVRLGAEYKKGIYFIQIYNEGRRITTEKIIKL